MLRKDNFLKRINSLVYCRDRLIWYNLLRSAQNVGEKNRLQKIARALNQPFVGKVRQKR